MVKIPEYIRYVFFDVDGVLSAPAYFDDELNELVIGFSDEKWQKYLNEEGIHTYRYCKPLLPVIDLLKQLKQEGISACVLSTVADETEAAAKDLFLNENYPELFTERFYVRHDADKRSFLEDFARKNELKNEVCLLIDDTYTILLQCRVAGFSTAHIANVLADNISK